MLGIPAIYDRVCQQALLNRLEPIFEPIFDDASFGYRRGRSTKDALRKIWKEIQSGSEWIVDADLRDFFGSVDHEKLLSLVAPHLSSSVCRFSVASRQVGNNATGSDGDIAQGCHRNKTRLNLQLWPLPPLWPNRAALRRRRPPFREWPERRTSCSNSQITGEQTTPEAIPLNIYERFNWYVAEPPTRRDESDSSYAIRKKAPRGELGTTSGHLRERKFR